MDTREKRIKKQFHEMNWSYLIRCVVRKISGQKKNKQINK